MKKWRKIVMIIFLIVTIIFASLIIKMKSEETVTIVWIAVIISSSLRLGWMLRKKKGGKS